LAASLARAVAISGCMYILQERATREMDQSCRAEPWVAKFDTKTLNNPPASGAVWMRAPHSD